jgi:hypothetical protein
MKFEGDDMEGKLYILQLYHSYRVLISILNIMIAVYRNLHIAWYKQSHERRTRMLSLRGAFSELLYQTPSTPQPPQKPNFRK